MKKQWMGVFVAVGFAASAVLGAQERPSPANTPPPDAAAPPSVQRPAIPAAPVQAKANTVTISGCVQDTPLVAAAGKPADAPPAPPGSKTFYLNNATMAADAGRDRPAVGTSGLSSTGYRLDGDTEKLTPHLNHQVRIVGTVQNASSPGAPQMLKVDSVTMVSMKCDPVTAVKP